MTEVRRRPGMRRPNEGGVIDSVRAGSIAEEIALRPGDRITAIDGHVLRDAVDFQFLAADSVIQLEVVRGGEPETFEIEKHPDEDLGLGFQDPTFDSVRTCNNKCFFCFLKGNPKGMRKTLYVKDDDYRLSFYHGNFVTLTNLTESDWERIAEQRLSPLNVSVHATEPSLRRYLLGNEAAPDICAQIRRLGAAGIKANTQVVCCPGVNDGAALDRTIGDLAALYPTVRTISIVPVGATIYAEERIGRQGAHGAEIDGCTPEHARRIIAQAAAWQRRLRKQHGRTLVYLADEYYLAAGVEPPGEAHYDGFPQFENGIGMTRSLIRDWRKATRSLAPPASPSGSQRVSFVCGTLIAPTLSRLARKFEEVSGVSVTLHPLSNGFFGPRVNVSGLLVAADIVQQLRGRDLGDLVVLPRYALDYTGERFLDDGTPASVQEALGVPIAFASTLSEALRTVRGAPNGKSAGAARAASTNGKAWVDYTAAVAGEGLREEVHAGDE